MIRTVLLLGITILMGAVLVFGGCSAGGTNEVPDLVGWIDSIQQPQGQTPGQILVNSPDNSTSDKFLVTVTDKTAIHRQMQNAAFDSFNVGQKVEIWFSGPVMESYPAQVSAEKIVIAEVASSVTLEEISYDVFMSEKHITKEIEINYPGSLTVSLASNPTTGFQWEEVKIGDLSVITEYEHKFVPPEATGVVGASGKDVWTFKPLGRGTSTLIFEYSQPWEGGEKDEWTLGLTVVIK
ncbi:protease inhibitor I42 family protein [Chloroflexota bacterium]